MARPKGAVAQRTVPMRLRTQMNPISTAVAKIARAVDRDPLAVSTVTASMAGAWRDSSAGTTEGPLQYPPGRPIGRQWTSRKNFDRCAAAGKQRTTFAVSATRIGLRTLPLTRGKWLDT